MVCSSQIQNVSNNAIVGNMCLLKKIFQNQDILHFVLLFILLKLHHNVHSSQRKYYLSQTSHFYAESHGNIQKFQSYPQEINLKMLSFIYCENSHCPLKNQPTDSKNVSDKKLKIPYKYLIIKFLFYRTENKQHYIFFREVLPIPMLILLVSHFLLFYSIVLAQLSQLLFTSD